MFDEFLLISADARAETSKSISRAHHHRETDPASHSHSILKRLNRLRHRSLGIDLIKFLHKKVSVLGDHDCLYRSAEHLHAILLQRTIKIKFRAAIQGSLASESQKNTIRAFLFDHLLHEMSINREEIDLIGNTLRSLDSCDIRVDKHCRDPLLAQSLKRLRAGVIKFARLSYLEGTRAE